MKNPNVNWNGYLTFAACFAAAIIFFVFVIIKQPGPVDALAQAQNLPVGISSDDNISRKEKWYQPTPEAAQRGALLYSTNCKYCHAEVGLSVENKVKTGDLKFGGKQLDFFRTVTRGMSGSHRFEYLLENDRWALVHYLRSLNPQLPSSNSAEFKKYLKEGI